jgi:hypothetical protein
VYVQTARTASILFLIALSGCTEKLEANDPPAIGLTADPGVEIAAENAPLLEQASDVDVSAEPPSEPQMQSPVQYD